MTEQDDNLVELTISQFANELQDYYQRYTQSQFFKTYTSLEARLSHKARTTGYLELQDLADIAEWGGNQHAIRKRLQTNNSPESVRQSTQKAIQQIENPASALKEILVSINHWGLSYASKTLRFINPEKYAALDQKLRRNIDSALLPTIYDGHVDSMIKGYLMFIDICHEIHSLITAPGPRLGKWFVADIEMGLFQFVWDNGRLIGKPWIEKG